MELSKFLFETNPRHSDMVDAMAYMWAAQEFKWREEYTLLYLQKRPWWLPKHLYKWIVSKIVVLAYFKK